MMLRLRAIPREQVLRRRHRLELQRVTARILYEEHPLLPRFALKPEVRSNLCLLYTSDAADEL